MAERDIFKRLRYSIDWWLFGAIIALIVIGVFAVYSASFHYGNTTKYVTVQLTAFIIGFVLMLAFARFNYQYFRQFDKQIYAFSILLLISVLIFGITVNGAKRWIGFGVLSFQPVEVAKIVYILVLASFLDKNWKNIRRPYVLVYSVLILLGHFALIMLQPAFSSSIPYFLVTLILLYAAGAEIFYLLCIVILCVTSIGIPFGFEYLRYSTNIAQSGSLFGQY